MEFEQPSTGPASDIPLPPDGHRWWIEESGDNLIVSLTKKLTGSLSMPDGVYVVGSLEDSSIRVATNALLGRYKRNEEKKNRIKELNAFFATQGDLR